jgi:uncharacterized Tic20 family protein
MKQPDLGLKIADLRLQKGLTQEKLAEYCEVSTRTIQRIESGEVEPRAFTRNNLSNMLEFDFGEDNTQNENFWLAALHLSSTLCILVIPLLIWSWKKKSSYKIDKHGRDVLNFQITVTLMLFAAAFFMLVILPMLLLVATQTGGNVEILSMVALLSIVPLILIGFFTTYQGIVNTVRVLSDKPYKYRLSIPFVK